MSSPVGERSQSGAHVDDTASISSAATNGNGGQSGSAETEKLSSLRLSGEVDDHVEELTEKASTNHDPVLPVVESLMQQDALPLESPLESISGFSLVDGSRLSGLSNDDGFHAAPHTIILPAASGLAPKDSPVSLRNRFTVSPAQIIPSSHSQSLRKHVSGAPSRTSRQTSTSTVTRASTPPSHHADHMSDIQFKMSDMSLHKNDLQEVEELLLDADAGGTFHGQTLPFERRGTESMIPLENFDDLLIEVDECQKTIQSLGGISVDTQDSATYETAPLQCGNIKFMRDAYDSQGYQAKKHYVCVPAETTPEQVSQFMSKYWGLRNPKIVLSVISDIEHYKPWKNQRLKDDFEKGIIKAANATNMWIVTNGIDGGIAKLIGDAVRQEKIQQINNQIMANPVLTGSEQRRKRFTVIGVLPKDSVAYGVFFDGTDGVQIKNVGQKPSADIYELNPDHTHFIMVEDEGKDAQFASMRFAIEKQLQLKYGRHKRIRLMSIDSGSDCQHSHLAVTTENTIPVVGLLVQGSPRNIDHVLYYLQNKMPIVVLKGSGGIADMIAHAFEEISERGDDLDYQENFLKPELIKLLAKVYPTKFEENDPAKFSLRDKIIECARLATESSSDQANMTVVNIKGWGSSLKDLDKFILMALFKSEKREGTRWREQLQSDLQLTVDWNRPDLAAEIFQQDFARVRVDKSMFEQSLLKKDREQLIDLFLSQGVRVHKFLNHKKLKLLFEKAEDKEFFLNVCMEQVLGLTLFPDQPIDKSFLSENLNRLIYKLTGIKDFIQPYELSMSSTGMYITDTQVAERRALNSLMIWAILMNRHKLAKTLWTKCDEPICIALISSMIYRELSKYSMEQFQKTEMEDNAREFGEMALGILEICWQDSSLLAYNMLSKKHEDYNNKSVIEIAYDAKYIHFLAHPCCQKWLTKTWFGNLQVKELDWGIFRLPYWFKILVSVFFILPMYIWITFIPPKKKKSLSDEDLDEDEPAEEDNSDEEDAAEPILTKSALEMSIKNKKAFIGKRILNKTFSFRKEKDVPFWQKICLLWNAPITKFWTSQTFYFAYLAVFCFATLWPTCGNQYLDIVLWLWTATILLELVCGVYMKYHRFKTLSLATSCIEIVLITLFLLALLVTRIMQNWVILTDYIHSKTLMCFGLIYFFYRLLGTYLLISPTLGPMLHRINRMVKHDLVAFIRMFLIFMIAGGVTIQAIIYPNWPIDWELIKRILTRPIYAMFLTQVDDLDGHPSCSPLYKNSTGYCAAGSVDATPLQRCPRSTVSAYFITLQYLLICKLVLVTLLFAMFSLTIAKVDKEASQIWKFQRYALITDLIERFSLPPPFTIFSILYLILKFIFKKLKLCVRKCIRWCTCCKPRVKRSEIKSQRSRFRKLAQDDTNFWKQCAREFMANAQAEKDKDQMQEKHGDILISLTEDLKAHRKSMKRLGDRVVELERMVKSSRLYLEDIAHKLNKTDVQGITDVKGQFIHVAARQSPYPGTSIARFPVFDKYVPWELPYDVYDPKVYTLPKKNFPEAEMHWVDEDILEIIKMKEEQSLMTDEEVKELPPLPVFKPTWNAVITYRDKKVRREVDRRSWIDKDNQPLRYALDTLGIPINPMGRTGIRGKGVLWRWGPNHLIKAVVTRWRRKYSPDSLPLSSYLYVDGKRVLEFISIAKEEFSEGISETNYGLPGDVLHGDSNTYTILCKAFKTYVLDQPESEQTERFDQTDMIQYFAQFSCNYVGLTSSVTSLPVSEGILSRSASRTLHPRFSESHTTKTETEQQGFSATLLYKGYLDDPRNTDNAWVEAEVWNFHYDLGDDLDIRLKGDSGVKWKEVSPYVKMFGNESVIVQEAAKIHDAYH